MDTVIKQEAQEMSLPVKKPTSRKDKVGRWSTAESYLFESLLERYGKNWKKIHDHMKNRTLSQIRSHAQKYFDKVGPARVQEFERRAKLLEAYETLEKEKLLKEMSSQPERTQEHKPEELIKHEEESPLTDESGESNKESIIKEQGPSKKDEQEQSHETSNKRQVIQPTPQAYFPFLQGGNYVNHGFLIEFLSRNPQAFYQYQGIEPFVDNAGFRAYAQRHN